jgi:multiple sugar transport system ATP-binding protein
VDEKPMADGFPVELEAVTPLNEKTLLLLRTNDGRELLASEAGDAAAPRRHGPAHARLDSEAVLLFDAASGKRILPEV